MKTESARTYRRPKVKPRNPPKSNFGFRVKIKAASTGLVMFGNLLNGGRFFAVKLAQQGIAQTQGKNDLSHRIRKERLFKNLVTADWTV